MTSYEGSHSTYLIYQGPTGALESDFILQTFAVHNAWTENSFWQTQAPPRAALALSTTAVSTAYPLRIAH